MSVAKSLSEDQVAQIRQWADDGAQLPEVQKRLAADLNIKVTYMELRFLLDDLKIELKALEPPPKPKEPEPENAAEYEDEDDGVGDNDDGGLASAVRVTFSELVRPGMAVSGRATFANGKGAEWWVDRMGRLGLNPDDKDYRPTEAEMIEFQRELQRAARKRGY